MNSENKEGNTLTIARTRGQGDLDFYYDNAVGRPYKQEARVYVGFRSEPDSVAQGLARYVDGTGFYWKVPADHVEDFLERFVKGITIRIVLLKGDSPDFDIRTANPDNFVSKFEVLTSQAGDAVAAFNNCALAQ